MTDAVSILDQIDQADEQAGGGKGVWCLVTIGMAFRSFATGLTQEQAFHVYDPTDKASEEAAKKALDEIVVTAGGDPSNPQQRATKCVYYLCDADSAVGRSWSTDLNKIIPTWTAAWRGMEKDVNGTEQFVVGPAKVALQELAEAGKFDAFGKQYPCHIRITADPSGAKNKEDGQARMIWFVDEIYKDTKEMIAVAEEAQADDQGSISEAGVPEGWPADVWAQTKAEVVTKCEEAEWKPKGLGVIAGDYELEVAFLKTLQPA